MNYALVTGGSRGIGKAVCIKLAEMGHNVIINYTSNEEEAKKTQEAVKAKGVDAIIMKFDVGNIEQVDNTLGKWMEDNKDKNISVLVNNAGIRRDNLLVFINPEDWHKVMNIAVDGFYNVTRLVLLLRVLLKPI